MELSVSVPLPEDGSREVRLSVLHHLCPALFAAEITPVNDLAITLPPRIGMKAEPVVPQSRTWDRLLFQKASAASASPPGATGQGPNPFRPRRSETGPIAPLGGSLFAKKAMEDAALPAPQASAEAAAGAEVPGSWGSLFLDKVQEPEAKPEVPFLAPVVAKMPVAAPVSEAKAVPHIFEQLEEEGDEARPPFETVAPNPWAGIDLPCPVQPSTLTAGESPAFPSGERTGRKMSGHSERNLIFRAMFGTDDEFDLNLAANMLQAQDGINSVVLSLPPHLAEATSPRSLRLGEKALEMVEATRSLGRIVGMDNDTFSFQADQGFISLFTHGQQAVIVRHTEARLSPGVRERFVLSVRNLESLVG